jgi:hypothetical protein
MPSVENMPALAEVCVDTVERVDGRRLDYSVASLELIDGILGGFHEDGSGSDPLAETAFVFGAYVGEVMVRRNGGRWAAPPPELGGHFIVKLPNGNHANPIGKAFKRVDNGPVDSIVYFHQVMTAPAAPGSD